MSGDAPVINSKVLMEFERYCVGKAFQNAIKEQRKKIGMPESGFENSESYLLRWWLGKSANIVAANKKKKALSESAAEVLNQLNMPVYTHTFVEAYIALGKNFKDFVHDSFSYIDRGCALDWSDDIRVVKIYPGASQRNVLNFIKKSWKLISIDPFSKEPKPKQVRKRRKESRDEKIYSYYKLGLLRYSGTANTSKLREFLKKPIGAQIFLKDLDPLFEGMDSDTIRKVIQTQIKRLK